MQDEPGTLLILDGHNIAIRAYHALSKYGLSTTEGVGTWGVYGFLSTLVHFVNRYDPTDVVVTFDWGRSEERLKLVPDYKGNRDSYKKEEDKKKRQEARDQLEITVRFLEVLGIAVCREPNVEADDIIAKIAKAYDGKIVIVTADHDLRQLINANTIVVKPSIGQVEEDVYDVSRIIRTYGVSPERLPEIWALTGDTSDNVKGVPGIGDKTAISLIQKYGSLSRVMESNEKKIQGHHNLVDIAYKVIYLDGSFATIPIPDTRFKPVQPGEFGADVLLSLFEEYDFHSTKVKWITGTLWKGNSLTGIGRSLNA